MCNRVGLFTFKSDMDMLHASCIEFMSAYRALFGY